MKKSLNSLVLLLAGAFGGICLMMQFAFDEKPDPDKEDKKYNPSNVVWKVPAVPDQMSFAGEAVPLDKWEVGERLDREILYNYYAPQNIIYITKLANRYFPYIEKKLKAEGIPDDFKYLCIAESNLQNLVSRAGAAGFWQFMPASAPEYNLKVNSQVDERYDYKKATEAACDYLKKAYAKFGTWTAAAASYNCGMGGYNQRATAQGTKFYYDLLLPEETNRYIFRILAFKYLMENAATLGYEINKNKLYPPVETRSITVTSSISNLATWARQQGTTYKMVKLLNPWLRSNALTVKGGSYELQLPAQ